MRGQIHIHTHTYPQLKKLILNIVVSTVAATKDSSTTLASVAKRLLSRCWSLITRSQVRHWQEIQEFRFQDTNKLLLPNLALVKPLLLQSSVLEHDLSSKCQLTSSSPRTDILLHLSSELANSADTCNNKWLSATLVSKVFFHKESWAEVDKLLRLIFLFA